MRRHGSDEFSGRSVFGVHVSYIILDHLENTIVQHAFFKDTNQISTTVLLAINMSTLFESNLSNPIELDISIAITFFILRELAS